MKKIEIIREIAKNTQITQTQAAHTLEVTLDLIKNALKKNDEIRLVGFGSFKVATRKARKGINPQTKKAIKIPATQVAKFVPGKELKEVINTNKR